MVGLNLSGAFSFPPSWIKDKTFLWLQAGLHPFILPRRLISLIKSPPSVALGEAGLSLDWYWVFILTKQTRIVTESIQCNELSKNYLKNTSLLLTIWANKAVSFSVWWWRWRLETAISWSAGLNGTKNMQESGEPRGASLLSPLSVTQESLLTQWSIILSQIKPRVDCKAQHQHQQLPAAGWEYLLSVVSLMGPLS